MKIIFFAIVFLFNVIERKADNPFSSFSGTNAPTVIPVPTAPPIFPVTTVLPSNAPTTIPVTNAPTTIPTTTVQPYPIASDPNPPPDCTSEYPSCCQYPNENCNQEMCSLPLCNPIYNQPSGSEEIAGSEEISTILPPNQPYFNGIPNTADPPIIVPNLPVVKKPSPIDPELVGNIPHQPNYHWNQPTQRKYNKCFPRYETKYKKKCEKYEEKHCYTKHEEACDYVTFQNCALVPKETHERKCETVNEQICHLKKTYESRQVIDYVPKQKCHRSTKRLCDTVWQFDHATRDDFLCKEITKPKCVDEWKVLYDKTCKTTVRFDCNMSNMRVTSSGYGDWALNPMQQVRRYKNGAYGNNPYNPYKQLENFKCRRIPFQRCYQSPRRVKIHKCEEVKEHKCQKVTNKSPRPVQRQNCHEEPYEECEVEKQHQVKMAQVPKYTEECKGVPREICDNQGTTTLEVKCVDEMKPVCQWKIGEEQCENVPKEHCYQVPYQAKTTDCQENYHETIGDGKYPGHYGQHPLPYGGSPTYGRQPFG